MKDIWTSISSWVSEKVSWIADKLTFWKSSESQMNKSSVNTKSSGAKGYNLDTYSTLGISMLSDDIALSGSYYTPQTRDSLNANNIIRQVNGATSVATQTAMFDSMVNTMRSLLSEMFDTMKNQMNNSGDLNITIESFNNNREIDIQSLMEEMEYYRRQKQYRG